jgi:Lrp/AsnC family transcriptional regulator, regulator for asnA, asnC and gidA
MIDNLNQKIIQNLKVDGRYSCAKLAKDLGVNVATVTKRIDKMLADDIISIKGVVNPFRLGYNAHAFLTLDVDLNKINSVCSKLVNLNNVSLVAKVFGRFDVIIILDFPNWENLQEFISVDLPAVEGINKVDVFPIIDTKKIYNGLFQYNSLVSSPPKLDKQDLILIEELSKNGRLSFADLAERQNMSLTTVSRRVAHLKKEEIIKITAVRNPAKLGYLANAFFALHTDKNKINAICDSLAVYPEIHIIMTLMSGFEILAGIHLSNLEAMHNFIIDKVSQIEGVLNIETFICAETQKRSFALFEPEKS